MKRSRGMSLGAVLMVVSLAMLISFALASFAVLHLHLTSRIRNQQMADNLADSAISTAVCNLLNDPKFGASRVDSLNIPPRDPTAPTGSGGFLSFDVGSVAKLPAGDVPIPWSTNNFQQTTQAVGWTSWAVPPLSVQLIGMGVYGDVIRCRQAVIYCPAFPDCLAASGTIVSSGGLMVTSVQETTPDLHDPNLLAQGNLLPGDMISNSSQSPAITLDASAHITGDIRTCGTVSLAPGVNVGGGVYQHADPTNLPWIDVQGKIADVLLMNGLQTQPNMLTAPTLSGFSQANGSTTVTGDLNLNSGVLYVNGDLTVSGGIKGVGAVLTSGKLEVDGASDLQSDNRVAIMSVGDVTLKGSSNQTSFFQGLVYTQGNFSATNITLLGAFVANVNGSSTTSVTLPPGLPNPGAPGGNVTLNGVNLVQSPGFTNVQVLAFSSVNGVPEIGFSKGKKGGMLGFGLIGPAFPGWYQPNGSHQIPVAVTYSPPAPGVYTFQFPGYPPTTDLDTAVSQLKQIVKRSNALWTTHTDWTNFDNTIPDIKRRLMNVAFAAWRKQTGITEPNINMWGTDQNEFLAPPDQLRVEEWIPLPYL